jgi:hypothetical protein
MQLKRARYETQGADAIGRAYMAGLLGPKDSDRAKAMLDTARKLARDYRRAYENAPYRGTLGDKVGGCGTIDQDRVRETERQLADALRMVSRMGRQVRLAFDALVLEDHPDAGPPMLDSLIWASERGKDPHPMAREFLQRALDPLDILASGG